MNRNSIRATLSGLLNRLLYPLGLCLARRQPVGTGWTMDDLLYRYASRHPVPRVVVDLGAAAGCWSRMARKHFPASSFLLVDPLSEREPALQETARRLGRSFVAMAAAGEVDGGEVMLSVTDDLDGSTVDSGKDMKARRVPCRTVDSLVQEHGLEGPFFLKFDTHGFELPILQGCSETLRQTAAILMEVYNYDITDTCLRFPSMCQHLEMLGFRCLDLADPMQRDFDQSLWQMDMLFVRKDSPAFYHNHFRGP